MWYENDNNDVMGATDRRRNPRFVCQCRPVRSDRCDRYDDDIAGDRDDNRCRCGNDVGGASDRRRRKGPFICFPL